MKKLNGFTLIELLATIIILGIMASIAIPSFTNFVRKNERSSVYNNLVGTISLARIEAISQSKVIVICTSANQTTCSTTAKWHDGWMVFVDDNRNGALDTTNVVDSDGDGTGDAPEHVLRRESAAPKSISITSDEFSNLLSIAPRGRLRSEGSFLICDGENHDDAMALNLWVTGLGRLATDSPDDADSRVEDISGSNVTCVAK